jgi:hypothetical protein
MRNDFNTSNEWKTICSNNLWDNLQEEENFDFHHCMLWTMQLKKAILQGTNFVKECDTDSLFQGYSLTQLQLLRVLSSGRKICRGWTLHIMDNLGTQHDFLSLCIWLCNNTPKKVISLFSCIKQCTKCSLIGTVYFKWVTSHHSKDGISSRLVVLVPIHWTSSSQSRWKWRSSSLEPLFRMRKFGGLLCTMNGRIRRLAMLLSCSDGHCSMELVDNLLWG